MFSPIKSATYLNVGTAIFLLLNLVSANSIAQETIDAIYPQNPFITPNSGDDVSTGSIFVSSNGISRYDHGLKRTWQALIGLHTFEPVVTESLVLIGSNNGLYALSRVSGTLHWALESADPIFSPAVAGDSVYAAAQDGTVRAVDLRSGGVLWETKLEGWIYPPAFDQGRLILGGSAGRLSALSASRGELLWSKNVGQELVYRPIPAAPGTILITTFDGGLEAVSSDDGSTLWRVNESVAGFPPLVFDNHLYGGAFDGTIRARNITSGDLVWARQFVDKLPFMPRLYGDVLIVGSDSGSAAAFDRHSGERIWGKEFQLNLIANPVILDRNLITVNEQGKLSVHKLDATLANYSN